MKCLALPLTLTVLLYWNTPATAMCLYSVDAGFFHADLQRLPSNARGALMLAPKSEPAAITAASFAITSDQSAQPIPASIEWLTWEDQRQLIRIGPAGGFRAGVRYTIHYLGETRSWAYPAATTLTIDAQPLHSASAELVQDSAPSHRLLDLDRGHAMAGATPRVAVDLVYVLPPQYQPYASAMMYWSTERPPGGSFTAMRDRAGACRSPLPGSTLPGEGRQLLHTSCKTPGMPMEVQGRAALLEVEDATRATNLLRVDFDHAADELCRSDAILQQAVASGDSEKIRSTICLLERSLYTEGALSANDLPTMETLLALAGTREPPPLHCIMHAAAYRVAATVIADPRDQAILGDFLRRQVTSHDRPRIAAGLESIDQVIHAMPFRVFYRTETHQRRAGVLAPLMPALTALAQGEDQALAEQAARFLRYTKAQAAPQPANLTPAALPARPSLR